LNDKESKSAYEITVPCGCGYVRLYLLSMLEQNYRFSQNMAQILF